MCFEPETKTMLEIFKEGFLQKQGKRSFQVNFAEGKFDTNLGDLISVSGCFIMLICCVKLQIPFLLICPLALPALAHKHSFCSYTSGISA